MIIENESEDDRRKQFIEFCKLHKGHPNYCGLVRDKYIVLSRTGYGIISKDSGFGDLWESIFKK